MQSLEFQATEQEALRNALQTAGCNPIQKRSPELIATLIVALGGGIGIGKLIESIGLALKAYFEGQARISESQSNEVKIRIGELEICCGPEDVESTLKQLAILANKNATN